jgi:cell pole-organizing protein PopZ
LADYQRIWALSLENAYDDILARAAAAALKKYEDLSAAVQDAQQREWKQAEDAIAANLTAEAAKAARHKARDAFAAAAAAAAAAKERSELASEYARAQGQDPDGSDEPPCMWSFPMTIGKVEDGGAGSDTCFF